MEDKYYTPSISEFHFGFEYEILSSDIEENGSAGSYNKRTFEVGSDDGFNGFGNLITQLNAGLVRVKYLDKEDIVSLGFIESLGKENYFYKDLRSNSEKLIIELIQYSTRWSPLPGANTGDLKFTSIVKIHNTGGVPANVLGEWITSNGILYMGECKNKSELKNILRMIGYAD